MARGLKSRDSRNLATTRMGNPNRLSPPTGLSQAGGSSTMQSDGDSSNVMVAGDKWEMRLSLRQLVVLWSVIGGTMVMVFLFGLYAGREQGVKTALENHGDEAARLPVANPVTVDQVLSDMPPLTGSDLLGAPEGASRLATAEKSAEHAEGEIAKSDIGVALDNAPVGLLAGAGTAPLSPSGNPPAAELKEPATVAVDELKSPEPVAKLSAKEQKATEKLLAEAETAKEDTKSRLPELKITKSASIRPGWYLQIAAARNSAEASVVAKKLQASGLTPTIESAEVNRSTYYRVVLGPYSTKDAALSAKTSAVKSKAAKGEPFLKQIK